MKTAENHADGSASAPPPLCYIRHPSSGETVEIRHGEIEWTDVSPQAAYEMACLDD